MHFLRINTRLITSLLILLLVTSLKAHATSQNSEAALLKGEGQWRDVLDMVEASKSKVVYVLFSSFDQECKLCARANKAFNKFTSKQLDNHEFMIVDVNPWAEKELRTHLYFDLAENKPTVLVFYQKKLVRKLVNPGTGALSRSLKEMDTLAQLNQLERFGQLLDGRLDKIIVSDAFAKHQTKYHKAANFKAFALHTYGNRNWVGNYSQSSLSQEKANSWALHLCNQRASKLPNKAKCKLYWVNNTYVFNKGTEKIQEATASVTGVESPLETALKKLKKRKGYIALAYVENEQGRLRWHTAYNHQTKDQATEYALDGCNKQRNKDKEIAECKIYYASDSAL